MVELLNQRVYVANDRKRLAMDPDTKSSCERCEPSDDDRGKGYIYAVLTAIASPCQFPIVGIILGGTAAGALFYEFFWPLAIGMGVLSLYFFYKAARILL